MNKSVRNLIKQAGPRDEIAAECGVEPIAVYRWARSHSVPAKHFAGVIRVSSRLETGVTAEMLASAHDGNPPEGEA